MKGMMIGAGLLALFLTAPLPAHASWFSHSSPKPAPAAKAPVPMAKGPVPMARAPMAMPMGPAGGDYIDGELAFLKAEIKITDDQEGAWKDFAKAALAGDKEIHSARTLVPGGNIVDVLKAHAASLKARLEAVQNLQGALEPLYKELSAQQKAIADQLIPMHLNMLLM